MPTEGIDCNGLTSERFSIACFLFLFFPSAALRAEKESARLSENRAVETWNSLSWSSFSFYFEGLGSGVRSPLQGDDQGKCKPLPHQLSTKIKKEYSKIYFFPPFLFVRLLQSLSVFFKTCSGPQQGRSSSCCTSGGSSGPSRSSRRCPASSGAGAWEGDFGSTCHLGWSVRSC